MAELSLSILLQGVLKYRFGSKWITRICILEKRSPVADEIKLIFKKSQETDDEIANEKLVISSEEYCGVDFNFTEPVFSETYALAVVCVNRIVHLAFEKSSTMVTWTEKIKCCFDQDIQCKYQVELYNRVKSCSILGALYFYADHFAITLTKPTKMLGSWNLRDVKKYGYLDKNFGFEVGSNASLSQGSRLFVFKCNDCERIRNLFDSVTKGGYQNEQDSSFSRHSKRSYSNEDVEHQPLLSEEDVVTCEEGTTKHTTTALIHSASVASFLSTSNKEIETSHSFSPQVTEPQMTSFDDKWESLPQRHMSQQLESRSSEQISLPVDTIHETMTTFGSTVTTEYVPRSNSWSSSGLKPFCQNKYELMSPLRSSNKPPIREAEYELMVPQPEKSPTHSPLLKKLVKSNSAELQVNSVQELPHQIDDINQDQIEQQTTDKDVKDSYEFMLPVVAADSSDSGIPNDEFLKPSPENNGLDSMTQLRNIGTQTKMNSVDGLQQSKKSCSDSSIQTASSSALMTAAHKYREYEIMQPVSNKGHYQQQLHHHSPSSLRPVPHRLQVIKLQHMHVMYQDETKLAQATYTENVKQEATVSAIQDSPTGMVIGVGDRQGNDSTTATSCIQLEDIPVPFDHNLLVPESSIVTEISHSPKCNSDTISDSKELDTKKRRNSKNTVKARKPSISLVSSTARNLATRRRCQTEPSENSSTGLPAPGNGQKLDQMVENERQEIVGNSARDYSSNYSDYFFPSWEARRRSQSDPLEKFRGDPSSLLPETCKENRGKSGEGGDNPDLSANHYLAVSKLSSAASSDRMLIREPAILLEPVLPRNRMGSDARGLRTKQVHPSMSNSAAKNEDSTSFIHKRTRSATMQRPRTGMEYEVIARSNLQVKADSQQQPDAGEHNVVDPVKRKMGGSSDGSDGGGQSHSQGGSTPAYINIGPWNSQQITTANQHLDSYLEMEPSGKIDIEPLLLVSQVKAESIPYFYKNGTENNSQPKPTESSSPLSDVSSTNSDSMHHATTENSLELNLEEILSNYETSSVLSDMSRKSSLECSSMKDASDHLFIVHSDSSMTTANTSSLLWQKRASLQGLQA